MLTHARACPSMPTGQAQRVHFNTSHLEQMGAVLCSTLRDYWAPAASSPVPQLLQQLELLCPPGCAPSSSTRIVMVGGDGNGWLGKALGAGGADMQLCIMLHPSERSTATATAAARPDEPNIGPCHQWRPCSHFRRCRLPMGQ